MTDETPVMEMPLNEMLIKSREAKALSLESVASQLNLSIIQLEKLESESLNPAELNTFERGYVRNYAALLGLDSPVIEAYFSEKNYVYSELHSVRRYGSSISKPLLGRSVIKWLLIFLVIGLMAGLILSVFPGLLA